MRFTSALFALALLALLTACAVSPPPPERPVPNPPAAEPQAPADQTSAPTAPAPAAPSPRSYRAGIGVVESASVVSLSSPAPATAGGTATPATSPTMAYRLKMADGTTQDVVLAGERFELGDRVQVSSDGRLSRP